MTRDLAASELSLLQILDMDTDKTSALATIPLIQELVPLFRSAGTQAEVGLAALVHSLATVKVVTTDGQVRAKWELTSLVRDAEGKWLPGAATWADFCLTHLGLDPATASRYKRVWGTFAGDLGFDHTDLARAGICNLRLAIGTVARMYPKIDMPLMDALFGNEHKCVSCGAEQSDDAPFCQSCGEEFEPTPPGGPAAVALRLKQLKPPSDEDGLKVLPDVQPVLDGGLIIGWVITPQCWYEGKPLISYVQPWLIDIIPDDAPKDAIGVREQHASAFAKWLKRRLG